MDLGAKIAVRYTEKNIDRQKDTKLLIENPKPVKPKNTL